MTERRTQLRQALCSDTPLLVAGVFDGISARIADKYGFDALFMTGNGAVASALALPDLGLASSTEMTNIAAAIAGACRTPLIADADTGYGGVINVRRTVRGYEDAGVAALQIEDQQMPKRCGQSFTRQVVDIAEMAAKVRCVVETRRDPDLLIVARTDSLHQYGLEGALARAEAYSDAGADILMIEGLSNEEEYRAAAGRLNKPLVALVVDGRETRSPTLEQIGGWGAKVAIYPSIGMLAAAKAFEEIYGHLKTHQTSRGLEERLLPFDQFMALMQAREWQAFEERMLGSATGLPGQAP